jgi:hypothetical protein
MDDGLRGAGRHGRWSPPQHAEAPTASFPSEPERSRTASTSVVSACVHPRFEQSEMRAGSALSFAVENSVVNGGSRVSDTAKSQVGQINEFYHYALIEIKSRPIQFSRKISVPSQRKIKYCERYYFHIHGIDQATGINEQKRIFQYFHKLGDY